MQGYASRTGSAKNLDAMREHGWRVLVSAKGVHRSEGFGYAIDNGAWTAHQRGEEFDFDAFEAVLSMADGADWVIAPDIVAGGQASLALSLRWVEPLLGRCRRVLIAVQDGITPEDVAPYLGPRVGVAIGGSTPWKLEALNHRRFSGLPGYLHALRVNTVRRIQMCHYAGCDSFDGTNPTKFSKNTRRLSLAIKQESLPWVM